MHRRDLIIQEQDAWAIQQVIKDNTYFIAPSSDGVRGTPDPIPTGLVLRQKINDALLRFADEPDLETVGIDLSDEELWLIDRLLPVTSYKGAPTLLQQCFRILLETRLGIRTMTIPEVKRAEELKRASEEKVS